MKMKSTWCRMWPPHAFSRTGLLQKDFGSLDNDALNHGVAEEWAPLVEGIAKTGFTHVVAGASSFSKGLFPRVSALLDVAQVSDIIGVKSEDTFVRPIYAGNALATVKSEDAIKEPLLRPAALTAPCQPRPSSPCWR